jgi:ADP-ribose pyrophosphatase YjhB (NUDIX family)
VHQKNSYCSYCGEAFGASHPWPRTCVRCECISYLNPIPVVVTVLPVDDGVLCVRRSIPPGVGKLALPGGFLDVGETWQQGAARELYEETGIKIDPGEIAELRVLSPPPPESLVLIFGRAQARTAGELPAFVANSETSELVILRGPEELAFPLHTQVLREFFAGRGSGNG